jgi:hypothetical protein
VDKRHEDATTILTWAIGRAHLRSPHTRSFFAASVRKTGVSYTDPTVNHSDPYHIDWAEVAARARAELGDEPVAHFSDRLRMTMMATAGGLRSGDTEGLRFGDPPLGA